MAMTNQELQAAINDLLKAADIAFRSCQLDVYTSISDHLKALFEIQRERARGAVKDSENEE